MTNSQSTPRQNASLDQYTNAGSGEQNTEAESSETTDDNPLLSVRMIDDPHVRELTRELTSDEIRDLVESMIDTKNVMYSVQEVTDNDELANNIDAVTDHYADRPSLVEAAADSIEEAIGMRPFELTITEPENECQTPMISLDVEDDVVLTENPDINAEIVAHATRMQGVTENGQRRVFNDWQDALGGERVAEFKRDRDPDALGFSMPGHIPATGKQDGRTPVTEIPYIGEATAEDLHPNGELMSIDDYLSLTDKQHAWINMPVDNTEYGKRHVRGIARGLVELVPDDVTDALGRALNMMDRREKDSILEWVDPSNAFGITNDESVRDTDDIGVVASAEPEDDGMTVTTEHGDDVRYSTDYWELLDAVAEATETEIHAAPETPASLRLPDDRFLIAAPLQ